MSTQASTAPRITLKKIRVRIPNLPIRLGQFLKYADIVANGLEAKALIQNGKISVNEQVELRRGRQLGHEDQVSAGGLLYIIEEKKGIGTF
jgi:ribosome-associated protein